MRIMSRLLKFCLLSVLVLAFLNAGFTGQSQAFSEQVIMRGATGDDVIELQARLQYIGYYDGNVDGVYGWGTYWGVRNFQNDFGLEVDGYVGDEMKERLNEVTEYDREFVYQKLRKGEPFTTYGKTGKGPQEEWGPPGQRDPGVDQAERQEGQEAAPTPEAPIEQAPAEEAPAEEAPAAEGEEAETPQGAVNVPEGFSDNDLQLMANAVYGEARGEPYEGQVAVAAVIINRVNDSRFPNTVSEVIFEPLAFTAVMDGQIYMEPNETAERAVMDAINGWDPSEGLVYYFNPDTATSDWMFQREQVKQIGKHVFLR